MKFHFDSKTGLSLIAKPAGEIEELIHTFGREGMNVLLVHSFGSSEGLQRAYNIGRGDCPVLAYLATREPKGVRAIGKVVRKFASRLGEVSDAHDLKIPLFSGGSGAEKKGLMRQWVEGATEGGRPAQVLSMHKLLARDEIPHTNGVAVCLYQADGYVRIGYRTDGLASLGKIKWGLIGGSGTCLENAHFVVNHSVDPKYSKYMFLYDPLSENPRTGEKYRYYHLLGRELEQWVDHNTLSEEALRRVMNHTLNYQPSPRTSAQTQVNDMVGLTLLAREYMIETGQEPEMAPMAPDVRRELVRSLSKGSKLASVVPPDWGKSPWQVWMEEQLGKALPPVRTITGKCTAG